MLSVPASIHRVAFSIYKRSQDELYSKSPLVGTYIYIYIDTVQQVGNYSSRPSATISNLYMQQVLSNCNNLRNWAKGLIII